MENSTVDDIPVETYVSPQTLKQMAEEVRRLKSQPVQKVEVDEATKDKIVSEIEEYMIASAQEGYMDFTYSLGDHSREMLEAVATSIRKKHPNHLMIIKDGGANQIILNWSGKNEV